MDSCAKSAHRPQIRIGMLALVLALVCWGVQYKTSLIFRDQGKTLYSSSRLPAKIFSESEKCFSATIAAASHDPITAVRAGSYYFLAVTPGSEAAPRESEIALSSLYIFPEYRRSSRSFIRPPPLS
jgi:hypothetical protein